MIKETISLADNNIERDTNNIERDTNNRESVLKCRKCDKNHLTIYCPIVLLYSLLNDFHIEYLNNDSTMLDVISETVKTGLTLVASTWKNNYSVIYLENYKNEAIENIIVDIDLYDIYTIKVNREKLKNIKFISKSLPPNEMIIMIVGEMNSGKSSLINAFIGDEIVETGIRRTTTEPYILQNNKKSYIKWDYNIKLVEMNKKTPFENFQKFDSISIIDTIGFNDKDKDEEIYKFISDNLHKVSLILFCTPYDQCFRTKSEQEYYNFISSKVMELNNLNHPICFETIITKVDNPKDKELNEQINQVNNFIKKKPLYTSGKKIL